MKSLIDKWIRAEQQYRTQVAEARKAGTPYQGMMGHADQLAECRRELQEAAGLVASHERVTEIVAQNKATA